MMRWSVFYLGVLAGLALLGSAGATTWNVLPDGSGDFPTIQAAIDGAQPSDVILLADGTFTGSGNRDLDFGGKAITIQSASLNAGDCIIDCQGTSGDPHRGFYFHSGEGEYSIVHGITITNGYAGAPDNVGGGILCSSSCSPTLVSVIFSGNQAQSGGGLECIEAAPILGACDFFGNHATLGGGMAAVSGGPMLTGCRFEGNTATQGGGGGLFCNAAAVVVNACQFYENSAADEFGGAGGGMSCAGGEPFVISSYFAQNIGGGFASDGGTPQVVACDFWGNTGTFTGAITLKGGCVLEMAATIVSASVAGPAVLCLDGSTATLSCCDLFGNHDGDYAYCVEGQNGTNGNISADPLFCDPGARDFRLQESSPCANNLECTQIGPLGIGCVDTGASTTTWGAIKALYR